jgi:hypothetical protein
MKQTTRRRILLACSGVMAIAGAALLSYDRWSALVPTPDPADRARRMGDASRILIGYGDPATFYVPPCRSEDAKLPRVEMRAAAPSAVWFALDGIEPSLAQYPPGFVTHLIKAIFVSGTMTIDGERAGGTYGYAWVLLAASADIGAANITMTARRGGASRTVIIRVSSRRQCPDLATDDTARLAVPDLPRWAASAQRCPPTSRGDGIPDSVRGKRARK